MRDAAQVTVLELNLMGGRDEDLVLAKKILEDTHYLIRQMWLCSPELRQDTSALWEVNTKSRRLWNPNPFLMSVIDTVEAKLSHQTPRRAVDVACGSGRDSVFLLERGWNVVGIDFNPHLLALATTFASRFIPDTAARFSVSCIDLEDLPTALSKLPPRADVVHVARYLHRPLLPHLRDFVLPGGFIIYHTFMEPAVGKPNKIKHLLHKGELLDNFGPSHGFTVIDYRESTLEDRRHVQFICSQKNPDAS
ncbi:Methyltransferase type 11 [Pelomyxa schiedti]|nr:Methyltransferase type 11 [Pelomyxa schiedti]